MIIIARTYPLSVSNMKINIQRNKVKLPILRYIYRYFTLSQVVLLSRHL